VDRGGLGQDLLTLSNILFSRNHIPLGEERPWGKKGPGGRRPWGKSSLRGERALGEKKAPKIVNKTQQTPVEDTTWWLECDDCPGRDNCGGMTWMAAPAGAKGALVVPAFCNFYIEVYHLKSISFLPPLSVLCVWV
jgi:hypothetical protein